MAEKLYAISKLFFDSLQGHEYDSNMVRSKLTEVFDFVNANRDTISSGVALKIIRFLKDVHESIENTMGLKMHGTARQLACERTAWYLSIYSLLSLFPLWCTPWSMWITGYFTA